MAGDYLWDRSGAPDPDLVYLERLLPRVREQVRRAPSGELSPRRDGGSRRGLAVAALALAAGVALAVGAWQLAKQPEPTSIHGEPASVPAAAAPAPNPSTPAPEPTPPPKPPIARAAPPAPTPTAAASLSSAEPEPEASARSPAEIQAVVARHRHEVKERCWEPALAKRKEGAASSVRLSVTFTIEANGSVTAVKAGASPPDYPGLASCVAGEVRAWSFGPASAALVVAVPFVFAEG
ncbi:MAG: AgmX/PglI C-terminal domain-containing protein [Myxococcales bacterium]|nr:AgmX/PglI C-terminal domain-containing protein [Myxococcales bacterium]